MAAVPAGTARNPDDAASKGANARHARHPSGAARPQRDGRRPTVRTTTDTNQTTTRCKRCRVHPGGMCPACTSSCRQRALALREKDGLGDEQIAARLSVSVGRAQRFIAEAEQLRDLEQYKRDSIPVAPIRELFERRVEEDPALTQVRVAKRAKTDRIQLRRALGLSPTASRTVGGKRRPGSLRTEITVEMASRIVQALDVAPHEIPWL
jgi:Fe-S-cluster-containing dehydrogenase component